MDFSLLAKYKWYQSNARPQPQRLRNASYPVIGLVMLSKTSASFVLDLNPRNLVGLSYSSSQSLPS
jgi:hypothetical protein